MRLHLLAFLVILGSYKVFGQQDSLEKPVQVFTEVNALVTTGKMVPFWLRANQYGTVPLSGSFGSIRAGVASDYRASGKKAFDWGYGVEVVGNVGASNSKLLLPQAYVKARWKQLELYVGRKKNIIGLVDTLLTSGAYTMSGNALPLPTIQLGTRGFVPIGFTKGLVKISATFGHAWFENANRKVTNTYLHQATFYTQIGKSSWPVRIHAGVNHMVTWGGYSPYLPSFLANNGHLPSSFKAYLYAVTALAYPDSQVDGNVTSIDEGNRIGNHLGSVDLGISFDIGNYSFFVYRQNPYETGAIVYLTTIADGLNGLSIRRKQRGQGVITVDRALLEFFYTANQGGNQFVVDDPQQRGKVDYFNNSQYLDGWTTRAHTIGNAFITPAGDLDPANPYGAIVNNRVSLWHLGLSGRAGQRIDWQLRLSQSHNLGTYNNPLPGSPNQFSGLLQMVMPAQLPVVGDVGLKASLAVDQGSLLPNAVGIQIGLRKTWIGKQF